MTLCPSPALKRGIDLLRLLNVHKEASLEELTKASDIPKPTTMRLLQTLEQCHVVKRDPITKRYIAIGRIVSSQDSTRSVSAYIPALLEKLCLQANTLAEWWEPGEKGLVLVNRHLPDEMGFQVAAKQGFTYEWQILESLVLLGRTQWPDRIGNHETLYRWNEKGEQIKASKKWCKLKCEEGKKEGWLMDEQSNSNGNSRLAFAFPSKKPQGILALAFPGLPFIKDRMLKHRPELEQCIDNVQSLFDKKEN